MTGEIFELIFVAVFIGIAYLSKAKKKKTAAKEKGADTKYKIPATIPENKMTGFAGKELKNDLNNKEGAFHGGHTHNRLDADCFSDDSGTFAHYKAQLDGFLKSGIIEKDEYKMLLDRYSRMYKK